MIRHAPALDASIFLSELFSRKEKRIERINAWHGFENFYYTCEQTFEHFPRAKIATFSCDFTRVSTPRFTRERSNSISFVVSDSLTERSVFQNNERNSNFPHTSSIIQLWYFPILFGMHLPFNYFKTFRRLLRNFNKYVHLEIIVELVLHFRPIEFIYLYAFYSDTHERINERNFSARIFISAKIK